MSMYPSSANGKIATRTPLRFWMIRVAKATAKPKREGEASCANMLREMSMAIKRVALKPLIGE